MVTAEALGSPLHRSLPASPTPTVLSLLLGLAGEGAVSYEHWGRQKAGLSSVTVMSAFGKKRQIPECLFR